jgi:AI-2 transport protein TqsA
MHDAARTTNHLLMALLILIGAVILKLAAPVFVALLLAALLVYVIDPVVVFLQRLRLPLWLSALVAVVFFLALFLGLGILISFDLRHLGSSLQRFQEQLVVKAQKAVHAVERALGVQSGLQIADELRLLPIGPIVISASRSVSTWLSEFLLIFFFAIILLMGKYRVIRLILTVFPRRHSLVPLVLKHVDRQLRAFLGIKTLAAVVVGAGTAVILLSFRVGFAVTWGFLAIILNFVPALGPTVAVILPVLVATVQFEGPAIPLVVAGSLLLLHMFTANFLEPRLFGERLNLSFFVIFVSLFFWGWMWGAAGVLLAVPLTASLKIVLERIPTTTRIAMLLGRAPRPGRRRVERSRRPSAEGPLA